jgi:hypothetical protein
MKQQPDKIFHEKLNSFAKSAPPMAWDQIESRLDNRRKTFVWFSVAASVSVLLIAGYVYQISSNDAKNLAQTTKPEKAVQAPKEKNTSVVTPLPDSSSHSKDILQPERKENRQQKIKSDAKPTDLKQETYTTPEAVVKEYGSDQIAQAVTVDSAIAPYQEPKQLAFKAPAKTENITIVMSAAESSEYLVKNKLNTQATSEEKKSSTLKKLLKKAADLKVNQDPFGELRQKKNEILALSFRSEKQRGQKK